MEPIPGPALRSRNPSLRGRRRGGMHHVAPVAMMTGRGALGRPSRGHGEDGIHRDHQTSIAPHKALLRPHKIRSADCHMSKRKYRTGSRKICALRIPAETMPRLLSFFDCGHGSVDLEIWKFLTFESRRTSCELTEGTDAQVHALRRIRNSGTFSSVTFH
jgi:hypothetical protein